MSCEGCRFWSVDEFDIWAGLGEVAICLNPHSPEYDEYAHSGCDYYYDGTRTNNDIKIKFESRNFKYYRGSRCSSKSSDVDGGLRRPAIKC